MGNRKGVDPNLVCPVAVQWLNTNTYVAGTILL